MAVTIIVFTFLWFHLPLSGCNTSNAGFVKDIFEKKKFLCPSQNKLTFSVVGQIQCVGKCAMKDDCMLINYLAKDQQNIKDNCEIFVGVKAETSCHMAKMADNWLAMIFQGVGEKKSKKVYASCKEILHDKADAADGVYQLVSGNHYCMMSSVGECGGGGWTLAMKINGSKNTFQADSNYWSNHDVYGVDEGLKDPQRMQAKYPAFSHLSFQSICVGMTLNGTTNWIHINKSGSSLLDIFQNNLYSQTAFGPMKWKDLIGESCLHLDCNDEGFNVQKSSGDVYIRIGVIGKKKSGLSSNCNQIKSFIGIGMKSLPSGGCADRPLITCGNLGMCGDAECDKLIPAIGTILVK